MENMLVTRSLVYKSPFVYEAIMAALYGRHYWHRQLAISRLIPEGKSVVDVCCGPGTLYTRHLKARHNVYTGIDLNEQFIRRIRRAGAQGIIASVEQMEEFPAADYLVMQASLYHFLPNPHPLLKKMVSAARERVIISEPIRNLTDSRVRPIAWFARLTTDAGNGRNEQRFNETLLSQVLSPYNAFIKSRELLPGGREACFVIDAVAARAGAGNEGESA